MLISRLHREKVALLLDQSKGDLDVPSDLHGVIYLPYKNDLVKEVGVKLVQRFREAGMILDDIKVSGLLGS
jgi:predicted nucleotide-binding protein